jgi:predicted transcriptional regulator
MEEHPGAQLKKRREAIGLGRQRLASWLGVATQRVYEMEERTKPAVDLVERVDAVLGRCERTASFYADNLHEEEVNYIIATNVPDDLRKYPVLNHALHKRQLRKKEDSNGADN